MIKHHQLDGPDHLTGDVAPDQPDRSDLGFFYPEAKRNTQPLFLTQEDRHRQHDEQLAQERTRLHRYVIQLTLLFTLPLIVIAFTIAIALPLIAQNPMAGVFFTVLVLMAWVYGSWWAYARFLDIFGMHGIRGGLMIAILSGVTIVTSAIGAWLLYSTDSSVLFLLSYLSIIALAAVLIATKILISIATQSLHSARQTRGDLIE